MTPAQEDYLKAIDVLGGRSRFVSNKELIGYLGHSGASVSEMLQQLKKNEYIHYQAYKGSMLSDKGIQQVCLVSTTHRLWEVFLVDHLHLTLKQAHQQADLLEHNTSAETYQALRVYLGDPMFCPHGYPLHDDFKVDVKPLIACQEGDTVKIEYYLEDDDVLDLLQATSLKLKSVYVVKQKSNQICLVGDDQRVEIDLKIADQIMVSEI